MFLQLYSSSSHKSLSIYSPGAISLDLLLSTIVFRLTISNQNLQIRPIEGIKDPCTLLLVKYLPRWISYRNLNFKMSKAPTFILLLYSHLKGWQTPKSGTSKSYSLFSPHRPLYPYIFCLPSHHHHHSATHPPLHSHPSPDNYISQASLSILASTALVHSPSSLTWFATSSQVFFMILILPPSIFHTAFRVIFLKKKKM